MKAVISELGFSSNEKFEDEVGLGHGFVNRIKSTVSVKSMDKIRSKFPQVNPFYIKAGIGEMFVSEPVKCDKSQIRLRFRQYLRYKGITKADFIAKTGLSNAFPLAPANGTFSASTAYKISSNFPDLNQTWLVFGIGDMLQDEKGALSTNSLDYKTRIVMFCEEQGLSKSKFLIQIKSVKTSIMQLPKVPTANMIDKIRKGFPQLNVDWLLTGEGNMLNQNAIASNANITFVPLVPQHAYAGYLSGYADTEYVSRLPTIPIVKEDKDDYVAFEVNGDSMDDGSSRAYQSGDIVICKLCPDYIVKDNGLKLKGKEYIIVHRNGILLKRIKELNLKEGKVVLQSFNPLFDDLTLSLADVRQFLVVEYQQKRKK